MITAVLVLLGVLLVGLVAAFLLRRRFLLSGLGAVTMWLRPPGASSPSSGACPGRTPSSPSVVRAMTMLASPDQIIRSTATSSTCRVATTLLGG